MDHPDFEVTDSGRQVLQLAHDEAERLGHEYVGTEHIVLALTHRTQGTAGAVFRNLSVDLDGVRNGIEAMVQPGSASPLPDTAVSYTSRAKTALALARESALTFGQARIGAEHLIVGVLREASGIGAQALMHYGRLSVEAAVDEITRLKTAGDASQF
ncbi:MAG: Clp protease N-terminal domain-containing protein [Gemmatimonadales bacterium]